MKRFLSIFISLFILLQGLAALGQSVDIELTKTTCNQLLSIENKLLDSDLGKVDQVFAEECEDEYFHLPDDNLIVIKAYVRDLFTPAHNYQYMLKRFKPPKA